MLAVFTDSGPRLLMILPTMLTVKSHPATLDNFAETRPCESSSFQLDSSTVDTRTWAVIRQTPYCHDLPQSPGVDSVALEAAHFESIVRKKPLEMIGAKRRVLVVFH
jgi:hypothetical protein